MDNISHAIFGSSIIHALWGKKYGNRPAIYALLASNIPDIDIAVRAIPWVDALRASFFHRTATHSLLFAIVFAPLIWWVVAKILHWREMRKPKDIQTQIIPTPNTETVQTTNMNGTPTVEVASSLLSQWFKQSRKDWTLITLVAILSHIFLDWCTTYGVWLLWPFVDIGFEANIIAVVDMFFTLPLLAMVVWMIYKHRTPEKTTKWRFLWVWFATVYLICMTFIQQHFKQSIQNDMAEQKVVYNRVFVWAQILQPFLRYGMVELPDWSYKLTYKSIFDKTATVYENTYGYHEVTKWIKNQDAVEKLITRAHGWYKISQWANNTVLFHDMRFGRVLWWNAAYSQPWMFTYTLDPNTGVISPEQPWRWFNQPFSLIWQKYWERVWGW